MKNKGWQSWSYEIWQIWFGPKWREKKKRKKKPHNLRKAGKNLGDFEHQADFKATKLSEIPVIIPHCSSLKSNAFFVFLITPISHACSPQIPPSAGESQIQQCKCPAIKQQQVTFGDIAGGEGGLEVFAKVRALSPSVEAAPLLLLLDADVLQAQRARDEADLAALLHQPPYPPVIVVFLQHREGFSSQIPSLCDPHCSTPHWITKQAHSDMWAQSTEAVSPHPVPCWFNFKVDLMSRTRFFELRPPNNLPAANIKITPSASRQILLVRFNGLDKISPLSLLLFWVFVGMLLTGYDRLRKIHL